MLPLRTIVAVLECLGCWLVASRMPFLAVVGLLGLPLLTLICGALTLWALVDGPLALLSVMSKKADLSSWRRLVLGLLCAATLRVAVGEHPSSAEHRQWYLTLWGLAPIAVAVILNTGLFVRGREKKAQPAGAAANGGRPPWLI